MATIYNPPKELKLPVIDFSNFDNQKYIEANEKYVSDLRSFIKKQGYTGKNSGEVIKFPVADGHAQYMVMEMKPLKLIHLPLVDAWEFPYVHLLTAKEVQQKIDQQKSLEKFFADRKSNQS